jgi:hypothetical protein
MPGAKKITTTRISGEGNAAIHVMPRLEKTPTTLTIPFLQASAAK